MITKNYEHQSDAGRLTSEIIASGKPQYPTTGFRFYGVNTFMDNGEYITQLLFADDITAGEITEVDAIVAVTIPLPLPQPTPPVDSEDKPYVRSEPRPLNCTTMFTGSGDTLSPPAIGTGPRIIWDASITGDWTTSGAPSGYKQKTIDLVFCDDVYMRAGHIFTSVGVMTAYLDLYVMCPNGAYYYDEDTLLQNTTGYPIPIDHNIVQFPLNKTGSVLIDSETASSAVPPGYPIRAVISIPDTDDTCKGSAILMLYRHRTVVL